MGKALPKRHEVDVNLTWDLSHIFKTEREYQEALDKMKLITDLITKKYQGKLVNAKHINDCLNEFKEYLYLKNLTTIYASLSVSTDQTNIENNKRMMQLINLTSLLDSKLRFIVSELNELDETIIKEAIENDEENSYYLEDILYNKRYTLNQEVEKVLTTLQPILNSFYNIYNQAKLADMKFNDFLVDEKSYPLSFVIFENTWEYENDTKLRRTAFSAFSNKLKEYQNTVATCYQYHVQKEKIIANLRGFDSVFDFLLHGQKVSRELYDRQIDIIMEELAPHMRKYARLLKKIHNLDTITFADLKLAIDPNYEVQVSIEESKTYIEGALQILGDDYLDMVKRAYKERWIDFVSNVGKSTGAFCSSPYGVHPYILISWSNRMREVFVLAHELGHAGHFYLAQQKQNILNTRPSQYFIEAPSTMNELLMANYLLNINDDLRFKRWVFSSIISRTYYHNFVTHLLEAHFQREVYKVVDEGGSINAKILNQLKKATLEKFWQDEVIINEGAELTWMRQPHYYMGLYPYTYSAGLTISTIASKRILNEGQKAINDWRQVLEAGGTKTPIELARLAQVDITTDKPLRETIAYIGDIIDDIIKLTEEIDGVKL